MSQFEISRRLEIDAAHRVPHHGSKCFNIHGHRYVINATVQGPTLNDEQTGMVMDFGFLKDCMTKVIYDTCDHGTIFWNQDKTLQHILNHRGDRYTEPTLLDRPGWKLWIIPVVPTAENLAKLWFELLDENIRNFFIKNFPGTMYPSVIQMEVYETPNCVARYPSA